MRSFRALYYRHVTVAMLDSAHAHRFFFSFKQRPGLWPALPSFPTCPQRSQLYGVASGLEHYVSELPTRRLAACCGKSMSAEESQAWRTGVSLCPSDFTLGEEPRNKQENRGDTPLLRSPFANRAPPFPARSRAARAAHLYPYFIQPRPIHRMPR